MFSEPRNVLFPSSPFVKVQKVFSPYRAEKVRAPQFTGSIKSHTLQGPEGVGTQNSEVLALKRLNSGPEFAGTWIFGGEWVQDERFLWRMGVSIRRNFFLVSPGNKNTAE